MFPTYSWRKPGNQQQGLSLLVCPVLSPKLPNASHQCRTRCVPSDTLAVPRRHYGFSRCWSWLLSVALIPGLIPQIRADAPGATRFHHTEWKGLGAVFDIKQSAEGYLWLTTSRGVLRFDGVRFQSVGEVTRGAALDSEIDSVFLSPSGGTWLTTQGAGLLLWKDGRLTTFPDRRCTPARKQGKLVEDWDGSLWVQATAGLFRLRGSVCEQIGVEQGYPGRFPAGIFLDSDGTFWVKTATGPLLFLPRGQSRFQANKYGEGISTSFAWLGEGPDGAIWLSDDQGLRRVASKLSSPDRAPLLEDHKGKTVFGDFTFAPDGALWATTTKGVRRFDHVDRWPKPVALDTAPGEDFTPEQGLSSDAVWRLLIDREGSVWVATNSALDRLRRAPLTTVTLPRAQEREFSVAAGDQGSVWTGNSTLPLTHVAADGTITSFPATRQTITVLRDHNGTIWSAGAGDFHLWRSSGRAFSPLRYPEEKLDPVLFVAVDRKNDPWITTSSGRTYQLFNGEWSDQSEVLGKKPGVRGALADDEAGNVWFAFSNKVVKWDGTTYYRFSFPDGQRGVSQNTMSVRGDHVWLAGAGGVQLFTQGRFHLMRWKDQGLPGRLSGIVETRAGDLWMNGFSGITHVSASELKKWLRNPDYAVSGERLDELDGLPGLSGEIVPQPSVVEAPDGRLWFATTKGVAWLDPAALEPNRNRVAPPLLISAVISNGKNYGAANGLTLPAYTENLEIDYTALSLAIPERVLFRYQLDGVDDGWQNAGTRRQAYYTKLLPGQYKFHVTACNNDGVWNEAGAMLDFKVSPAWHQTTWFLLLCVACSGLLVWVAHRLRVRKIAADINARFTERLDERTRIAQDLHDTLLQGFLSASMRVHIAADSLPDDSQAKSTLTRALQLMAQVTDEGRNALRGLRVSNSASLDLEQAFTSVGQEFNPEGDGGRKVEFRVISQGERRPLHPLLRDEVYRIGREAITNAFRHARANHIDVELRYSSNQFRILIRDDGCGIEQDLLVTGRDGHWGLCGIQERADRIGARLQLFSSAGAGTEVELSVPGRIAFQDYRNDMFRWFRRQSPLESDSRQSPTQKASGKMWTRRSRIRIGVKR
jgi:signal transduction histidine kinase/ligand-binding sensor domain-containing protein